MKYCRSQNNLVQIALLVSMHTKLIYTMKKDMRKIVEQGYDQADYAGTFRVHTEPNKMERYFLNKLIKHVGKNAKILDLGCGIGLPIDRVLVANNMDVTGIDISQKHIRLSQNNVPGANFIKGDFSKYNFGGKMFDGIVSLYAIFHIPREEHRDLFLKIHSLLVDNGVILVTLGTSGSEYGEEQNWCGAPMVWSTYEPEAYTQILDDTGFKIIEDTFEGQPGDDEYHYWVFAKKDHARTIASP